MARNARLRLDRKSTKKKNMRLPERKWRIIWKGHKLRKCYSGERTIKVHNSKRQKMTVNVAFKFVKITVYGKVSSRKRFL